MGTAFDDYCMPYSLFSPANPDFCTQVHNHLRATCLVSRVREKSPLFFTRAHSSFLLCAFLTDTLAADNAGCIDRDENSIVDSAHRMMYRLEVR